MARVLRKGLAPVVGLALWAALVGSLQWVTRRVSEPPEERLLRLAKASGGEIEDSLVRDQPELARKAIRSLWDEAIALRVRDGPAEQSFHASLRVARCIERCFRDPSYVEATGRYQAFDARQAKIKQEIEGLLEQADLAYRRRRFEEVAERAGRAQRLCRELEDPWSELRALHLMGNLYFVSGEHELARQRYAKVLAMALRLRDRQRQAAAMNNLAYLEETRGRFRKAAQGYRRVWDLGEQHGLPRIKAFALLYQGNLYHRLGVYERAAATLRAAEAAFHRLGEGRLEALVATNRGAALQRLGRREEALEAFRRSLERRRREGDREGRARTLMHVAELLNELGRPESALLALEQLLALTRDPDGASAKRFRWGALVTTFDIHLMAGREEAARAQLDAAQALAEAVGHPLDRIETLRRRAELLARQGQPDGAAALLRQAIVRIEALRATAELEEERIRFLSAQRSVYEGLAEIYLRHEGRPLEAFKILERSRARAFLDSLKGDVLIASDGSVPSGSPGVILTSAAQPARPEQILSALPPGAGLLHYTLLREGVAILGFDREGLRRWSFTSRKPDDLIRAAESFARQQAPRTGERISRELLMPLESFVDQHPRLIIVPDGVLFRIPWACLPWRGGYLVETHEIVLEPSASSFAVLRAARARSSPPKVLLVADPGARRDAMVDGKESMRPLREAQREARELAGLAGASRALVGTSAGESAVVSELPGHDILHFATHSLIVEEQPLASSLRLAGVDHTPEDTRLAPVSPTDGVLTGYEVLRLRLRPGALVTLAACESVGKAPERGEGVVGLARAFFEAGAGGVIASLWPVDDGATRQLMVRFYRELVSRPSTAAAALRAAQSALAQGAAGERLKAPFFWAGFVLIGDLR